MSTGLFENANIRFSTQIIKRLGEELNPSIDQSILELVKNSYDADSTSCVVTLSNVGSEGGSVIIEDDGDGMDGTAIKNSYLVLGQSGKSYAQKTRLGRIPAGSKGLGRLAALRMGAYVELESLPRLVKGKENKINKKQTYAGKSEISDNENQPRVDEPKCKRSSAIT